MSNNILERVRKMNWVLQQSSAGVFSYTDLCESLSELMNANVYIVNIKGEVVGSHYSVESDSVAVSDPETGHANLPGEYNEELLKVDDTRANLISEEALQIFKYNYETKDKLHTIIPILGGGVRMGTLVLTRYEPTFTDEDLILAEYGATVVGIEFQRRESLIAEEDRRKTSVVQMAIATLSYSEIEAVQHIFAALDGMEGLLIASKIADQSGITRSVIVNALRKLESAGVIESRSLGMKGTHIKILNDKFIDELQKAKY